MERFAVVTAQDLKPGDCFYFLTDQKKEVHTVHGKELRRQYLFWKWMISYDYYEAMKAGKRVKRMKYCFKDTKVVFLRNAFENVSSDA